MFSGMMPARASTNAVSLLPVAEARELCAVAAVVM
jgi:hypothetical protein